MTALIQIGNSQGIRIPKAIIEQACLENKELRFKVLEDGLLIQPVKKNRQGWKEQFDREPDSQNHENHEQDWLDAPLISEAEWEW
jgi:antitoxin MazE